MQFAENACVKLEPPLILVLLFYSGSKLRVQDGSILAEMLADKGYEVRFHFRSFAAEVKPRRVHCNVHCTVR